MRGIEVFLNAIPGASLVAMRRGLRSAGITSPHIVGITEPRANSNGLYLTPNTETTYGTTFLDLKAWGPTVIEAPPESLCVVDDFWFRYVADMGIPGPDQDKGGRYLYLPPAYDGDVPDGYYTYRCSTYTNWVVLRALGGVRPPSAPGCPGSSRTPRGTRRRASTDRGRSWKNAFVGGSHECTSCDGARTYRLHVDPDPPAKNFWLVDVYDTQTRSLLQVPSTIWPALASNTGTLQANDDGSYDLYFGPAAPEGKESNWVETIPGKSWFQRHCSGCTALSNRGSTRPGRSTSSSPSTEAHVGLPGRYRRGMTLSVCVAGATGWTGRPVAEAVLAADDLELRVGGQPVRGRAGPRRGVVGEPNGVRVVARVSQALDGVDGPRRLHVARRGARQHAGRDRTRRLGRDRVLRAQRG